MSDFENKYPYTDFHELNLDWFLARFKEVTDQVTNLDATVKEFTEFVTNYFANLDVQEEINKKLDVMAADGTLAEILSPLLDDFREEINGEIDDQNDRILEQNGKITTLENRMDGFVHLEEGSTTGDAELADIRIGADGITYANAGNAVRGQYTEAVRRIASYALSENTVDIIPLITIPGAVSYSDGTESNSSSALASYKRSDFIPVEPGDEIYFSCIRTYTDYAVIAFYDTTRTYDQTKSVEATGSAGQYGRLKITAAGYIRACIRNTELESVSIMNIINVSGAKTAQDATVEEVKNFLQTGTIYAFTDYSKWINGSLSTSDGKSVIGYKYRLTTPEALTFSKEITINIAAGYRLYAYYFDETDTRIGMSGWKTGSYTIPAGSVARLILAYDPDDTTAYFPMNDLKKLTVDININSGSNENLPEYWKNYLSLKYPTLWNLDASAGHGDSFAFITDIHVERNRMKSPDILKEIVKNTQVNKVFCGGDFVDIGTKTASIKNMENWEAAMDGLKHFNIVGNHDNNDYNGSQPTAELTESEFYGIITKPAEQWIDTNGQIYYCVDNESQKIRYICVAIECFDSMTSGSGQRDWFEQKLTEKDSSWTILVIQHRIWHTTTESIDSKASAVISVINSVWNDIQADFIGIIAGHSHFDYADTEPINGYNLIAFNCDTNSNTLSGYDRTAGTTNEQSFDLLYINKDDKKLIAVRIGAGDTVVGSGTGIQEFSY